MPTRGLDILFVVFYSLVFMMDIQIEQIRAKYESFSPSYKDIQKNNQVERVTISALISSFEEAKRVHEFASRFGRISIIIAKLRNIIQKYPTNCDFKKILCSLALEVSAAGELSYEKGINQVLCSCIRKNDIDDVALIMLISRIVVQIKKYKVLFALIDECTDKTNQNMIDMLVYVLVSSGYSFTLTGELLYTDSNYDALLDVAEQHFPWNIIEPQKSQKLDITKPGYKMKKSVIAAQKESYYNMLIETYKGMAEKTPGGDGGKLLSALDEAIAETAEGKACLRFISLKAEFLKKQSGVNLREVIDVLNLWLQRGNEINKTKPIRKYEKNRDKIVIEAAKYIVRVKQEYSDFVIPDPLKDFIDNNKHAQEIMNPDPCKDKKKKDKKSDSHVQEIMDPDLGKDTEEKDEESNRPFEPSRYFNYFPQKKTGMSVFAKTKIEECDLSDGNIKLIDSNRVFIGTVKDAIAEYRRTNDDAARKTATPMERSKSFMRVARMLNDTLQNHADVNDKDHETAKEYMYRSLGQSFAALGDYSVKDKRAPIDVARFYYLEGMHYLLDPIVLCHTRLQDAENAAACFVYSFFIPQDEIPIPSYGSDLRKNLSYNAQIAPLFKLISLKNAPIKEFVVYLVQFREDETLANKYDRLLAPINDTLLGRRVKNSLKEVPNFIGYGAVLAESLHQQQNSRFINELSVLASFSFAPEWLAQATDAMRKLRSFKDWLSKPDVDCLNAIETLITLASEYNNMHECDMKANKLKEIIGYIEALKQKIKNEPSKIAFENIFELLPRFANAATKSYVFLCEKNPPEIDCALPGKDDIRIQNGEIQLQINVSNAKGCLSADSLSLIVENGSDYSVTTPDNRTVYIKGDSSETFQITLRITTENTKVFTLNTKVTPLRKSG